MKTPRAKSRPSRGRLSKGATSKRVHKDRKANPTPKESEFKIATRLMNKDIARSGLTPADGKRAGYKPLTRKQTHALTGNYALAYLITYHDAHGKKTDNWRVRYLEPVKSAFGALPKKERRYSQAKATLPRFYFPKSITWPAFNKNTTEPLIITEGEKKADKACQMGLPCIAVGGVWSWRSIKHGMSAIPDFKVIEWKGRKVWLCFDTDIVAKPLVIGALNALAHELTSRGAVVMLKHLPKTPGLGKLDDYLCKRSVKAFIQLPLTEYAESERLWLLNERLAFVGGDINAVFDFEDRCMYPNKNALLYKFANETYQVPKANGEGFVEKNAAEQWLKWKERRQYKDIGYFPGDGDIVNMKINTWRGYDCEPKKGSVKPFYDLLNFVFADDRELMIWFLQWLAYPLQEPGTKLLTGVLLHSRAQGVGKSFIGYIMKDIYGDNFNVVGQEDLQGAFNGWVVSKQFILGEEITGSNSRRDADRIKNMLTRESLNVSIKYQPEYQIADCAQFLFTSNHVDAFFLEDTDRRVAVHEITAPPQDEIFYQRIDRWRANGGAAHLFWHLLNDIDCSKFNSKAPAPITAAKSEMIALSKSDLDLALIELLDNPASVLRFDKIEVERDLFTSTEIASVLNMTNERGVSLIALSKALRRAGFRQKRVGTFEGTKRLWPLRNLKRWAAAEDLKWSQHYNDHKKKVKFK